MQQERLLQRIEAAASWSVEYEGDAYDDARQVYGVWYFRDLLTHTFRRFGRQQRVLLLFRNVPNFRRGNKL